MATTVTIENISNALTAADMEAILGTTLKNVSPTLTPVASQALDVNIVDGDRVVGDTFFNTLVAYANDNIPYVRIAGKTEKGVIVEFPVYGRTQYIAVAPGKTVTLSADDAVAEAFYTAIRDAFEATAFGKKLVTVTVGGSN